MALPRRRAFVRKEMSRLLPIALASLVGCAPRPAAPDPSGTPDDLPALAWVTLPSDFEGLAAVRPRPRKVPELDQAERAADPQAASRRIIEEIEARIAGDPAGASSAERNELRHHYALIGELRKSWEQCDLVFRYAVMEDYTLECLGARNADPREGARILMEQADKFPEFRFVAAACRIKAAELLGDTEEARALLREVAEFRGDELRPYRALAERRLGLPARSDPVAATAPPKPRGSAPGTGPEPVRIVYAATATAPEAAAFLEGIRRERMLTLVGRLAREIRSARSLVASEGGAGHVVVGRVILEGRDDPEVVQCQMHLHAGGYFVDAVKDSSGPIGFRFEGYEPLDVIPAGRPGSIEDLGEIRLRPLDRSRRARLQGRVEPEGGLAPGLCLIRVQLAPGPANSLQPHEHDGGRGVPHNLRPTTDGAIELGELTPGVYRVVVAAPGCYRSQKEVVLRPGATTDAGLLRPELEHNLLLRGASTQGESIAGVVPETARVWSTQGWTAWSNDGIDYSIRVESDGGRLSLRSTGGPFEIAEIGPGTFEDAAKIDLRTIATRPADEAKVEPRAGYLYLVRFPRADRFVVFAIDEMRKLRPDEVR